MYLLRGYLPFRTIILALAVFLSWGTASISAAMSHEAGGHCGSQAEPAGHEAGHAAHPGERNESLTGEHQSAVLNHEAEAGQCPMGSGHAAGESKQQCGHHSPPAGTSDVPSLYCNCHSKHTDGRAAQPAQEYMGLASQASSVAVLIPSSIVLSSYNPLPQHLFLDPVEKPPTLS